MAGICNGETVFLIHGVWKIGQIHAKPPPKTRPLSYIIHINKLKWISDFDPKTVKHLE